MTYESPKQIRRRQLNAENKTARRRARSDWDRRILTDEEWEATCDQHVACLLSCARDGWADSAGRHAQALVRMALERRALQIMRDLKRAYWKAKLIARHELYNCEL